MNEATGSRAPNGSPSRAALALLPNLGDEEPAGWRAAAGLPAVHTAARLWCALFDRTALPLADTAAAQEALHSAHAAPAFDWLAGSTEEPAGVAWYGGARAARELERAGYPLQGPPADVVERVHDKAFAQTVAAREGLEPPELETCSAVYAPDALADAAVVSAGLSTRLESWPEWARGACVLKPRFGSSGRGQVRLAFGETPSPKTLARLAAQGGAVLEPWLERCEDSSVVLRVAEDGILHLLGSLQAILTSAGTPVGQRGEIDSRGRVFSGRAWDDDARAAAARVTSAAAQEGFTGLCGVDGFLFEGPAGARHFRPVCEFNARFTTGSILLGVLRRAREAIRETLALRPGDRAGFCFALAAPRAAGDGGGGDANWEPFREAIAGPSLLLSLAADGPAAPGAAGPAVLLARDPQQLDAAAAALAR